MAMPTARCRYGWAGGCATPHRPAPIGSRCPYRTGAETHRVVIHGGWVEVLPDYVRVLTNAAENPNQIDAKRADEALKRAKTRVEQMAGNVDVGRALEALKRAQARVEAAKG